MTREQLRTYSLGNSVLESGNVNVIGPANIINQIHVGNHLTSNLPALHLDGTTGSGLKLKL